MRIDEHFNVAREFDAALEKLDRKQDGLAIIEMLMMAGTNYMNAVLHANKITPETFDLTHSYKPKPDNWDEIVLPVPTQDLMNDMAFIENARKRFARGIIPDRDNPQHEKVEGGVVEECLKRYANIKEVVQCVFARAAD